MKVFVHKFFKKSKSHFKILDNRRAKWIKFRDEVMQILGTISQNLVARVSWRIGFFHPCIKN